MKVRLSKKFAERLNGIDLSSVRAGDLLEVSEHEAAILIAEQWAVAVNESPDAQGQEPPTVLPIPILDAAAVVPPLHQPLLPHRSVVSES